EEAERESGSGGGDGDQREELPDGGGGLRQVLSRLDGLDNGMLVERALEDHLQGEGEQAGADTTAAASPTASGVSGGNRRRADGDSESSLNDDDGDDDDSGEGGGAAANATGVTPGALSAALNGDWAATAASSEDLGGESAAKLDNAAEGDGDDDDDDDEASASGRAAGEAAAAAGMEESPVEDKFILPGWHYLALSGRSLSVDLRWDNMDLVLMQDPTAQQGRDTGKNVLALRSSGALTVSSSGVGESVDVQLRNASLLPCFYADEASEGGDGAPADGGGDAEVGSVGPARRLALILGGGERALRAVARTWLGQGLLTADSRPLLEPFTVQIGYGTVVAQAVLEGRGTGVTDGRRRMSSGLSGDEDSDEDGGGDEDDEDDEGRLVVQSQSLARAAEQNRDTGLMATREDGEEQTAGSGWLDQSRAGESVSGVFRVAVSELQLLGPEQRAEELATVEVEVNGQTQSFSASDVVAAQAAAATVGGDPPSIELEFACRCRLRRRRRRRRRDSSADGGGGGGSGRIVSVSGVDATALDSAAGAREGAEGQPGESGGGADREEACTEEESERREPEPEAKARIRLRTEGGELLGEAWAELAGAPDDWARYPLYSPGAVGVVGKGASGGGSGGGGGRSGSSEEAAVAASGHKATGLDRGGVIPAPPATVRRRWGWGYRRSGSAATSRRWFRPRPPPRDVAGEVRLRLGWVPSGLAVTVHRCRAVGTAATGTAGVGGDILRLLVGGGRPRRSI
ncbi:unnamed protein product, partial [Hapterophycus canaliculatus]